MIADELRESGETVRESRVEMTLSKRKCAKLNKKIREKRRRRGGPSHVHLSATAVTNAEKKDMNIAKSLCGNVLACLRLIAERNVERLPSGPSQLSVVLSADGYNPGNSFKSHLARQRFSLGLWSPELGVLGTITVRDQHKLLARSWFLTTFVDQMNLVKGAKLRLQEGKVIITFSFDALAGDHGELWSHFDKVGGSGHKSTFCSTDLNDWPNHLHECKRLTLQGMHAAGFPCFLRSLMSEKCLAVAPPLHDLKGIGLLILERSMVKDVVSKKVTGHDNCTNFTGEQTRHMIEELSHLSTGRERFLAEAYQVLVFFRTNDVNVSFWKEKEKFGLMYGLSLLTFHIFCLVLQQTYPDILLGAGNTYVHSMGHAFDEEEVVPFALLDETFERQNGQRKKWYNTICSPQTAEQTMMFCELTQGSSRVDEVNSERPVPIILRKDVVSCCTECIPEQWDTFTARVTKAGLSHLFLSRKGAVEFGCDKSIGPTAHLHICFCNSSF